MVVAFHELETPADLATQLRVLADELAAVEAARAEEHGERAPRCRLEKSP